MSDLRKAAQDVVTVWKMHGTAESLRGWMQILEAALAESERDWSMLEATQESLREHMAEIHRLRAALAQQPEPVQEPVACSNKFGCGCPKHFVAKQVEPAQDPVAKVELMTAGGNAGLATRIVEIDDHLRERLRPGQLLYTAPPQRPPLTDEEMRKLWSQYGYKSALCMRFARAVERKVRGEA